jgi:GNAT superfamily N-acetyltransferase
MYSPADGPVVARAAVVGDRSEILRLVAQVYSDMHALYGGVAPVADEQWQRRVTASLDRRLGKDVAIFVVDGTEGCLASVAVGRISETLPSPRREHVLEGYIEWVGTDPRYRGRGYASAATRKLLQWFYANEAISVSLHASPAAESLYLRMGFSDEGPRALSIRLGEDQT